MTTKPRKTVARREGNQSDETTHAIIHEGCSIRDLATIFHFDTGKTKRLLGDLKPCGSRRGYPIYKLSDAAARLARPIAPKDFPAFIAQMKQTTDLPPLVTKEFWNGLNARLKFERDSGNLWSTDEVISHVSELLKTISVSIRLTSDSVARENPLSPAQREFLNRYIDSVLENAALSVTEFLNNQIAQHGGDDGEEISTATDDDTEL